jgi:two-component system sensor histidine kinase KdpD
LRTGAIVSPETSRVSLLRLEPGTPVARIGVWPSRRAGTAMLRRVLPSCLSLAGVAICTWASFYFGQGFAFTGFLFLAFVVLTAMYGGFWQATFISVAAAASLNYFFVPPIFSFVNSPANWVALGAFEFTALVISRLSDRAQLRAMEAIAERRDMERLYQTSRRILLLDSSADPGDLITALIREIFELKSVQLFDALSCTTYQAGESPRGAEQQTRDAYFRNVDAFAPETRSWYCVLRLGDRPVGGLALHDTEMTALAVTALASLIGIALERVRVLQREFRAQAARQTEQLRTSVLDALAHQFKTPLTVARTATSGLLTLGGLSELQTELVSVVDQQARKLDDLASRLLSAAMLDSTDFRPRCEPVLFSSLTRAAIQKLDQDAGRFHICVPSREAPVFVDQELMPTAVTQLVDNAIKYSEPGSPIDVYFVIEGSRVTLTVRNKGSVISPADCERVFERFYRAPKTHHMPPGTGLGLSIVKKIVEAHFGHVWAEGEADYGTSFSISLPAAQER